MVRIAGHGAGLVLAAVGVAAAIAAATVVSASARWARRGLDEARANLADGRPELARRAAASIRGDGPEAGEAAALAGIALVRLGRVAAARAALERGLALKADQPEAAKVLAAIYLSSGDEDAGLRMLESAARSAPADPRPWRAMGEVHHDMGRCSEAAAAFAEAVRRDPAGRDGRLGLIAERLHAGRTDDASAPMAEALREWPDDATVLSLAARHARGLGRPDEAAALAERALAREPGDTDALLIRAEAAILAGRAEAALPDLERAVAARPGDLGPLQRLAQVEARLGLADRAVASSARLARARAAVEQMDALAREVALAPRDASLHVRLGLAAAAAGRVEVARNCYLAALRVDPSYRPCAGPWPDSAGHAEPA